MKKNILLHGATNFGSSNYGDFIYGDIIYRYFFDKGYNVCFYQPSSFFKENIYKYSDNSEIKFLSNDLYVYIPGGYFGEGHNAKFKDNFIQFIRFIPFGLKASLFHKKLIVLGVGAGPLNNFFMRNGVKLIANRSELITVRDHESYECLKKLSSNENIIECGDLILTYKPQFIDKNSFSKQLNNIVDTKNDYKYCLIHYNHDSIALEKFAIAINSFAKNNPNYKFIVTADCILEDDGFDKFRHICNAELIHYEYSNPYELSTLISFCDLVLTCKLHVGVVACLLGKSVISVACHYEKTKRFYEQINESERCIPLYSCIPEDIVNIMNIYYNKNINIPQNVIDCASLTWKFLDKYMGDFDEK